MIIEVKTFEDVAIVVRPSRQSHDHIYIPSLSKWHELGWNDNELKDIKKKVVQEKKKKDEEEEQRRKEELEEEKQNREEEQGRRSNRRYRTKR